MIQITCKKFDLYSLRHIFLASLLISAAPTPSKAMPSILGKTPQAIAELTLPTGDLTLLRAAPGVVDFLDNQRSHYTRSGGTTFIYDVFAPTVPTQQGPAAQSVRRFRIDCPGNNIQELGEMTYGPSGEIVLWLPVYPAQPMTGRGSLAEAQFKLVCLGEISPISFPNYKMAFDAARRFGEIAQKIIKQPDLKSLP